MGDTGRASACHVHFGLSLPCPNREWWVRRGVIWPDQYLRRGATAGTCRRSTSCRPGSPNTPRPAPPSSRPPIPLAELHDLAVELLELASPVAGDHVATLHTCQRPTAAIRSERRAAPARAALPSPQDLIRRDERSPGRRRRTAPTADIASRSPAERRHRGRCPCGFSDSGGRTMAMTLPMNSAPPTARTSQARRSSPRNTRPDGGVQAIPRGGVVEAGVLPAEHQAQRSRRPGPVLGDDDVGGATVGRLLVVHLVAVQEDHDVRILLQRFCG